jgi:hypothetical protein
MAIPGGMTPLQTPVVAGLALALRNEERDRTPAIIIRQDTTGTSGTPGNYSSVLLISFLKLTRQ